MNTELISFDFEWAILCKYNSLQLPVFFLPVSEIIPKYSKIPLKLIP